MTGYRIDFLSPPFAGHLHPIMGMALALQPQYEVRVITTPVAAERVRKEGIDALSMLEGWESLLTTIVDTPTAVRGNPVKLYRQLYKSLKIHRQVRTELEQMYRWSRPDLMIADFTLVGAGTVAQAYGMDWWTSLPSPCILDGGNGPPCYLGGLAPRAGRIGKLRDRLGWGAIHWFKRAVGYLLRREMREIGVEAVFRPDGSEAAYSDQTILALGWQDLEFRTDWPSRVCFVPPFLYTPSVACEPPIHAHGRPQILITLGTHLRWMKDRVAAAVQEIAAQTPNVEYHFSDGDIGGDHRQAKDNYQRIAYVDYQSIRRYDLVMHHAGAGIMAHCLANGCPAVVYPVDYDQFDNAARLEHAGLACRLRNLGDLRATLGNALADQAMRDRCQQFALKHDAAQALRVLRARVDAHFAGGQRAGNEASK
jgi:UDP:flavonoid glycosyltransferase YjiC (YdhE family)